MKRNDINEGVGTIGLSLAVIVALIVTKDANCLWAFLFLLLIW